ncbi:MAG: glycosyltransferase [Gammaproteobacteria bacterium]|nr:glycosyltransferase [Gammaproteobacteria bacterium]
MTQSSGRSILQISHDYLGPFVSICRQYNLALAENRVDTLYLRGEPSVEVSRETDGNEVIYMEQAQGTLRGFKIMALIRLYRLIRFRGVSMVIAHRYKPLYLAGMMSYLFKNLQVVGVIHEHGVFKRLHRRLFLGFWRKNIKLLAVSESVAKDIERDCPFLGRGDRLAVQHHAIDIPRYTKDLLDKNIARANLGLKTSAFVMGTMGRLVKKKNQQELITAVALIKEQLAADWQLVIIGDGPELATLQQLVRTHGLDNNVIFSGYRNNAWQLLPALDLFVLTSSKAEAFGMVLLEAMLARTLLLVCDAPGPSSVVGDTAINYRTGDFQDLAGKLLFMQALPPSERERLTDSATRRLQEQFSIPAFQSKLLAVPFISRVLNKDT